MTTQPQPSTMRPRMIWGIPLRLFHAAFAVCLALALLIAFTVDEDSPLFRLHMLLGLTAAFLLAVRVLAGWVGGRYDRLAGLLFTPRETIGYLALAPFGKACRYTAHNPGTAAAALAMFVLIIGLAWTGIAMGNGNEGAEDLHEALAYGLVAAIGAHLAGLLLHTVHHRENIALSMITGIKQAPDHAGLEQPGRIAGLVVLLAIALWTGLLVKGYDAAAGTVTLPGVGMLSLGEAEGHDGVREGHGYRHDEDDD